MDRYQLAESGRFRAEREAKRLKAELQRVDVEGVLKVKEVCEYHDDLWRRTFPKARGLSYPMDGVNAKAVRRALRWGKDVDDDQACRRRRVRVGVSSQQGALSDAGVGAA
jgi:hypothetical protein